MSTRGELLEQRVAWLVVDLERLLELRAELSPQAREALLAMCGEAAGVLERDKLELAPPKAPRPPA